MSRARLTTVATALTGYGGQATCGPPNSQTSAFSGTSQSCLLVADIIQAFADTHSDVKPTRC